MYTLYARWIREGKLKPDPSWNDELKIKFTLQDPCQIVRKSFGDPAAEDMRFVVKACVGEENFVDMYPNRSNNFCCGGGGGFLQSGYKEQRLIYGQMKDRQIKETRASYCVTGCHNCHAQIHELGEHFEGGYHAVHAWTILALALGVLGTSERIHLGEELQEVNLPPEEGA